MSNEIIDTPEVNLASSNPLYSGICEAASTFSRMLSEKIKEYEELNPGCTTELRAFKAYYDAFFDAELAKDAN